MASSDDVFSGLPNKRPQRRSAKRGGGEAGSQAKKAPAGAGARPAAARGKRAQAPPARTADVPKPPPVPPAGYATPTDDDHPRGTDLIGTAVQAAGELALVGIAFGGRALKSAIQRLPRP
jgi:hypothetical protein